MSKKSNVNPNHYKTDGRDRPGDNLLQHEHRLDFTRKQAELRQEAAEMSIESHVVHNADSDVALPEDDVVREK